MESGSPSIRYVDVFGSDPFSGNPLAVIESAADLSTAAMQKMAHWLNLSETTFLLPPSQPGADYRVRIFTTENELPFAGHPTLGSCHAWLEAQGLSAQQRTITQECGAGLVTIKAERGQLAFKAPPLIRSGTPSPQELDDALRFLRVEPSAVLDASWVDNGPGWLGILLKDSQAVLEVVPDTGWQNDVSVGIVGACPEGADTDFEVRAFFKEKAGPLIEDPVTGSLNASLAQWLFASGVAKNDYLAAQGTAIGRKGQIIIRRDSHAEVWVGGNTRTCFYGPLVL